MKQHILTTARSVILQMLVQEKAKLRRIVALTPLDAGYIVIVEDTPESISLAKHKDHMRRGDY